MRILLYCKMARLAIALMACTLLFNCSHLTVTPKPVEAHAVAIGESNKPDADVLDCDGGGCLVSNSWLLRYYSLEARYKEQKAIGDEKIVQVGPNWRVPYSAVNHYAELKRRDRSEVTP